MATGYTSSLRLALPVTGELNGTWGDTVNQQITQMVEQAVAGYTSIAITGNYTLTTANGASDEARNMMLKFTGTLGADANVVVPTAAKLYFINNATTGGFSIVVKTSAGTGITVANGNQTVVYCDGTNVVSALNTLGSTLSVSGGGTGATTLTGVLKGNGTSAFTAATAGTDYVAPGTATTFSAQQSFTASGVRLKGSSTGYTTFSSANASATAYTITFPAATGTVLTTAAAVTVAQGGTGATTLTGVLKGNGTSAFTAATAGTDYAKPDTTSTWSAYQTHSKAILEAKSAMAANDIDLQASNYFSKTISTTTTLTVSNVPATGTAASFILDLTNGGAATITWWTGVKWAGGTAPTLTASGRDVLGFFTYDGGTTWTGLLLGKDVK